jgi:gliding motility-associated lipoprotein GldH
LTANVAKRKRKKGRVPLPLLLTNNLNNSAPQKTATKTTMNKLACLFAIATTTLTTLCACSNLGSEHTEWCDIDNPGWRYGQTLTFNADSDSIAIDRLVVSIRHTNAYEYANLWLELSYASGDTIVADTFNVELADAFGKWHGTGTGISFQQNDTIVPRHRVNLGSPLHLRHVMRVDTLQNIDQIGLSY